MEIKDLVSYYINESSQTIDVTFRFEGDADDEVRSDQVGFDEIRNFGYDFLDDRMDIFKDLFEGEYEEDEYDDNFDDFEEDEFSESVDENELISFLNEYYLIFSTRIPDEELF